MMGKVSRFLLITVLLAAICYSGVELWKISLEYIKEAQLKDGLLEYRLGTQGEVDAAERTGGREAADNRFVLDMQGEVNEEIIGWLEIPDTRIDYPIVKGEDNDFYLTRDVYRQQASAGSIFMDSQCPEDFSGFNNIIYGHNMKNKSMFGDLDLFAEDSFFESNRKGWIYLRGETLHLEIFAYMVIRMDDEMIYSLDPEQEQFMDYVRNKAQNFREPAAPGNIVTLSTCSYQFNNARTVLLGYVAE